MTDDSSINTDAVGYCRPPSSTRFVKGQSGNPKGRPKGKSNQLPYESVLGQTVTATENGQTSRLTAEEAFLLKLMKDGLAGDMAAARDLLASLEANRSAHSTPDPDGVKQIVISFVGPGSVTSALENLRMAKKLYAFTDRARVLLEPWIVEAALARRCAEPLSAGEQRTVMAATRTPWKVKWPDWWSVES